MLGQHRLEDAAQLFPAQLLRLVHENLHRPRVERRNQPTRNGDVLGSEVHLDVRDLQASCEVSRQSALPVIDGAPAI